MRVGVVTYPGTIDDVDAIRALEIVGETPVKVWHTETDLSGIDALIIPGGQSYGDYLRPGALAQTAPVTKAIVEAAAKGLPILGIGNGFQILLEAGLLEGALAQNHSLEFVRRDQSVKFANTDSAWTKGYAADEIITLPLRTSHGAFTATAETMQKIEGESLVVLRYEGDDPTGSQGAIAGIKNVAGNVVGILPHPEFAVEAGFGPDTKERMRSGTEGLNFFTSLV